MCARCVVQRADPAQGQLKAVRLGVHVAYVRIPTIVSRFPVFKVINKLSVPYPALLIRNPLQIGGSSGITNSIREKQRIEKTRVHATMATSSDKELFERLDELKLDELKEIMIEKGLSLMGAKATIKERLRDALAQKLNKENQDGDMSSERKLKNEGTQDESEDDDYTEDEELDVNSLKTKELRVRLKRLGLDTAGSKLDLKNRLLDALEQDENGGDHPVSERERGGAALAGKKEDVRNRHDGLMRRHRSDAISPPELSRVTAARARRMTTISPEERRMTHKAAMTFRDVEGVLDPFSGDDDHDVRKWVDEFEDTAELCEWSDMHKAIYARNLLRCSARLFVGYEDCKHSWGLLKEALLREFSPRIDSHAVHRKLQQRRKKSHESYHEYCYKMLEIGSQVKMDMSAVIQYIIDGVDGDDVNKIVLYGAQNITVLKLKLDLFWKE